MHFCLKGRLENHRKTSSLVTPSKLEPDPDVVDTDVREGLTTQRRLSAALIRYSSAVALAFEALLCAQEALDDEGIGDIEQAGPIAELLLDGLRKAQAMTRDMATAVSVPLNVHCATITACLNDIARADAAAMELRHYAEKVEAMDSKQEQAPGRKSRRIQRNCEKLQKARHTASLTQARAHDAVGKCLMRTDQLSHTAKEALMVSVKALLCMVPDMNLDNARPFRDRNKGREIIKDSNGHIGNQVGTAPNPFESDKDGASANGSRGGTDTASGGNPFELDTFSVGTEAKPPPTGAANEARDLLETNPFSDDLPSAEKDVSGPVCYEFIAQEAEWRQPGINPFEEFNGVHPTESQGSIGVGASQKGWCCFTGGHTEMAI